MVDEYEMDVDPICDSPNVSRNKYKHLANQPVKSVGSWNRQAGGEFLTWS